MKILGKIDIKEIIVDLNTKIEDECDVETLAELLNCKKILNYKLLSSYMNIYVYKIKYLVK